MNKLELPNITLLAWTSLNIENHLKALEYSCRGINFGKVKIVSPYKPNYLPEYIDWEETTITNNVDEWCHDIIYKLGDHIDTEFMILVHDDGFIVNPDMWRDEFLEYDYIGAPWPLPRDEFSYRDINGEIIRVGNSVSLRSKRLIDLPVQFKLEWKSFHGYYNEDGFINVNYRHVYLEHGMKFAPIDVAKYFSHETPIPEIEGIEPFMFHKYHGENNKYPRFT
jgi:hypothetical protein